MLQQQVEAEGWTWSEAQPPPAFEISEAALRQDRGTLRIWTIGIAEVVDGTVGDRSFRGGRLVGYRYDTTNGGIPFGDLLQTNAIWMPLPASLPEIRLADTTATATDYGLSLPPLQPPRTPDGRWQIETFIPAFAGDLLQPAFLTALAALPPLSAIVIRAGVILAYGSPTLDVPTVRALTRTLSALIDSVPDTAWGRADPLVAGTGVFPHRLRGGSELVLGERLVRPDWQGYGLSQKVPWQDAADAPKSVTLRRSEARDHWPAPQGARPGVSANIQIGGVTLGPVVRPDIPTVASTLADGTTAADS